jgi:pimeloyl-ACP methyl ester carboxylesterase
VQQVSPAALPGLIALAEARPRVGALWIGQLAGNGGRDVVIYVPPGAKPDAEVRLVVHFHGTYSENIAEPRRGVPKKQWVGWDRLAQTMDAMDELQAARDDTVVLVYPISAGKRPPPDHRGWTNRAYDQMWMMPADAPGFTDDFARLYEDVLGVLTGELGVARSRVRDKVLVEGHSAGGVALMNVALRDEGRVEEYLYLDASFRAWADAAWKAVQASKSGARFTLVITDKGIADPYGKHDPWCVTSQAQAKRYRAHAATCAKQGADAVVPGGEETCGDLEPIAQAWDETWKTWCAWMKTDMSDVADVYVHRTKVPHGKQPRHFAGGLELPTDRF